ncbi:MAG: dTMP kinase [Caldilineaceae bacterium]|nr:dTMP kinase [Caldilineaceae bacterium]
MSLFITFEGPEGGGKTTQVQRLGAQLTQQGYPVVVTREPGGTAIGTAIRSLLLDPQYTAMSPRAEALLFNAARAQLVDEVVRPALAAGTLVICDRFADSTLAYQGYGRALSLTDLQTLIAYATQQLRPHLTVFLDIPAVAGLQRKKQGAEWNRMEAEQIDFHQRVRQGFLTLAAAEAERWLVVDATQSIEEVQAQIWQRVSPLLGRPR